MEINILEACDSAAKKLGNTRAVCKNYYIHPAIIEGYEEGSIFEHIHKRKNKSSKPKALSFMEKVLLDIIKDYSFEI